MKNENNNNLKTQYTIIAHGKKRSERGASFETLDEARKGIKFYDLDPMLTTQEFEHLLNDDTVWRVNDPYLRTNNVVKFRTLARYCTGNPDTSLSIREEKLE